MTWKQWSIQSQNVNEKKETNLWLLQLIFQLFALIIHELTLVGERVKLELAKLRFGLQVRDGCNVKNRLRDNALIKRTDWLCKSVERARLIFIIKNNIHEKGKNQKMTPEAHTIYYHYHTLQIVKYSVIL